jgi:Arc/MetJ-type ribon-helix-helix transcriptional regulator
VFNNSGAPPIPPIDALDSLQVLATMPALQSNTYSYMDTLDMSNRRVISISMPDAQARAAEQLAKSENRTMSELVREALRTYEKQRRREIISEARQRAAALGIKEEEVPRIVKEVRRGMRSKANRDAR